MNTSEGLQEDLKALHQASIRMDELATRAQEERSQEVGSALVEAVGEWVQLVEAFVDRCTDEEVLAAYRTVTVRLEQLLSRLESADTADELQGVRQALPEVIDAWSQVMSDLIQAALASENR